MIRSCLSVACVEPPRMSTATILIVEDEPDIAELIRFNLAREGFTASVAPSGDIALRAIERKPPDLVMLDLMLPDMDGLEVCRQLKWNETTRHVPILIVSAKGEESDVVAGLELGADDYVTKPFSPKVLVARVRNILRRRVDAEARSERPPRRLTLADGRLVIDLDRHEVRVDDEETALTKTEFDILLCLATRPGFVRTRDQIIASVHGEKTVLASRTIDVHVTALRKKLGDLGAVIETRRGVGYRLNDENIVTPA